MLQGGLFTRDWLGEGIAETLEWRELDAQLVQSKLQETRRLLTALAGQPNPNEAETEERLIRPVLRLLGWEHIAVQQNLALRGRTDVPDALCLLTLGHTMRR